MQAFIGSSIDQRFESLIDDEILLCEDYCPTSAANSLFNELLENIPWYQENLFIYGRSIDVPRLMSWHGDEGADYRYSGADHQPLPWTSPLQKVREQLQQDLKADFNAVLLNLYRNGNDSMSWHADDEPELGKQPLIASLSLGEERDFQFRHRFDKNRKFTVSLPHGSLLIMQNECQRHWQHQLPKRKRVTQSRINLTFRSIV